MRGQDPDVLVSFRPEVWSGLDFNQRHEAVQRFENNQAREQGRPACSVGYDQSLHWNHPKQGTSFGYQNISDTHCIRLNPKLVEEGKPGQVMDTVLHEGRHAQQAEAIRQHHTPGERAQAYNENKDQVAEWAKNMQPDNYIVADQNFRGYWSQPVEVDARGYSERELVKLEYGNELAKRGTHTPKEAYKTVIEADSMAHSQGIEFKDALKQTLGRQKEKKQEQPERQRDAASGNEAKTGRQDVIVYVGKDGKLTFPDQRQRKQQVCGIGVPEPVPSERRNEAIHDGGGLITGAVALGYMAKRAHERWGRKPEPAAESEKTPHDEKTKDKKQDQDRSRER